MFNGTEMRRETERGRTKREELKGRRVASYFLIMILNIKQVKQTNLVLIQ